MRREVPITDERVVELVRNDPLAYRWYVLASSNGLSEAQFLTELLLAKYALPKVVLGGETSFQEAKKVADEFAKRYGLKEVR